MLGFTWAAARRGGRKQRPRSATHMDNYVCVYIHVYIYINIYGYTNMYMYTCWTYPYIYIYTYI